MSCETCKSLGKPDIHEIAQKRSTKTAHILADREAKQWLGIVERVGPSNCVALKCMSYADWYAIFFKKIYDHELCRNLIVERERRTYWVTLEARTNNKPLCDYHDEFPDDFCKKTYKGIETEYARTKWPKTYVKQ